MKNSVTEKKIIDAMQNAESYISEMEQFDDKRLSKHIDLFRAQQKMAFEQRNDSALELLQIYEEQVTIARLKKNFLNKENSPKVKSKR